MEGLLLFWEKGEDTVNKLFGVFIMPVNPV